MPTTKVFIADANSSDGTPQIALSYAGRLNISIIPGGLPSVGRNAGARLAESKYVLFIDAGIELRDPSLIRRAVETMKHKDLHCVTTNIHCRDGSTADSRGWKECWCWPRSRNSGSCDLFPATRSSLNPSLPCAQSTGWTCTSNAG